MNTDLPAAEPRLFPVPIRLAVILSIVFLHLSCYFSVNVINSGRPVEAFKNLEIAWDRSVPYLSWTGVIYYFGDLFILLFATLLIWKLPQIQFLRAAIVYAGMILTGAAIQLFIPARAPWSENLAAFQKAFHGSLLLKPYACLPSMHVALAVLPALIGLYVWRSAGLKFFYIACAVLISVSTVTFKEHYILDAVAGVGLAFFFFGIWTIRMLKRQKP